MRKRNCMPTKTPRHQKGVVMLFVIAVLVLGSAALFLGAHSSNVALLSRQDTVSADLQTAKQALIAYAVNYADIQSSSTAGPGRLPCADTNGNGSPNGGICGPFALGWLPVSWSTVGGGTVELYPHSEGAARRFWYAPTRSLRPNPSVVVNSNSSGEIQVDNVDGIVAVIIDPGPPLEGQTRPSNNPADYLEGGNEDNDGVFFTSGLDAQFNDRISYITYDELMPLVEKRVLGYVHDALRNYFNYDPGNGDGPNRHLPYASLLGDEYNQCLPGNEFGLLPMDNCGFSAGDVNLGLPSWFLNNGWNELIYYHVDSSCVFGQLCNAPDPFLLVNNAGQRAVIASVGRPIVTVPKNGMQQRTNEFGFSLDVIDYLDSQLSVDGFADYFFLSRVDSLNNDQHLVLEFN